MAQFVAFNPHVEVKGIAIVSVRAALGEKADTILAEYGLFPLDAEAWYSQQKWLDAFRVIDQKGFLDLVSIGMRIPDHAEFPPGIDSIEAALPLLDVAYQMNHRGGEIGEYHLESITENTAVMVCRNPYPSDFDYGLLYRMVQKFRPESSNNLVVVRDETKPSRLQGADSCTYLLEW